MFLLYVSDCPTQLSRYFDLDWLPPVMEADDVPRAKITLIIAFMLDMSIRYDLCKLIVCELGSIHFYSDATV